MTQDARIDSTVNLVLDLDLVLVLVLDFVFVFVLDLDLDLDRRCAAGLPLLDREKRTRPRRSNGAASEIDRRSDSAPKGRVLGIKPPR